MPSNPTRNDLNYWNKKIVISDSKHVDSKYGPIQIGKNNYYGPKITRLGKAAIIFKKIIPVLFASVVLAPISIPCIFAFSDLYRHVGRWVREVHYGRKLECINNIAGQALGSKSSQSTSASDTDDFINMDSNNVPLEVLDLVFSSTSEFKGGDEVKKYFDTIAVVCKSWNSRVDNAKLIILNAGIRKLHDLPRMKTKEAALSYIKANADQLITLDLSLYKMTKEDIPNILICKNLESLTIQGKNIGDNINLFTKLKKLTIEEASNLNISSLNLPQLEELNICCIKHGDIPNFGHLPNLKILKISHNKYLKKIPSLDSLTKLESLTITYNNCLPTIPSLNNLSNLKELFIYDNNSLNDLPSFDALDKLKTLWITGNDILQVLPSLDCLIELEKLRIVGCKSLVMIPSLDFLVNIKYLDISFNPQLQSIPSLSELINLESLSISTNLSLIEIVSLNQLKKLEYLGIIENESLQILPEMTGLVGLKYLTIMINSKLKSIPNLDDSADIERVSISYNPLLTSIPSLIHLHNLRDIDIFNNGESLEEFKSVDQIINLNPMEIL